MSMFKYEKLLERAFNFAESLSSSRIEGHNTTVVKVINEVSGVDRSDESGTIETANIFKTLGVLNDMYDFEITSSTILNIHKMVTKDSLDSRDHGRYRGMDVDITGTEHTPPSHNEVRLLMDDLIKECNAGELTWEDIAKIHHKFVWIHPFKDGNGRTCRLLTYLLFEISGYKGWVINPSDCFYKDRDMYYKMLSVADGGDVDSWVEYCITLFTKNNRNNSKLLKKAYFFKPIYLTAVKELQDFSFINNTERRILESAFTEGSVDSKRVSEYLSLDKSYVSRILSGLKSKGYLNREGWKYSLNEKSDELAIGVITSLKKHKHLNKINI